MNIGEFLHSKRWKLMQNYIYSWGASVVLIGALFKLEHLPGASVFLGVGLSIEAIIFFVSAFEPMMELPDWKVVYPQLRTGEESDRDLKRFEQQDELYPQAHGGNAGGGGSGIANINSEELNNLNESFHNLSETAKGLKNIADSNVATDKFVKNLNDASESIGSVVNANNEVSSAMRESVDNISNSYTKAAQNVDKTIGDLSNIYTSTAENLRKSTENASNSMTSSVSDMTESINSTAKSMQDSSKEFNENLKKTTGELNQSYKAVADSLSHGFKGLEKETGKYTGNLDKLNKNMAAINSAYELHLKGAGKVDEMVGNYAKGVEKISKLIDESVEETNAFTQNTKEINKNIQALNNIYGKMLGALNGK
ncbi:MAG TPA: gliding motility protein GldL [Bacteroidales bacterium]|nr:gliding motility protein GldL [Bacteroidales bacterium]